MQGKRCNAMEDAAQGMIGALLFIPLFTKLEMSMRKSNYLREEGGATNGRIGILRLILEVV